MKVSLNSSPEWAETGTLIQGPYCIGNSFQRYSLIDRQPLEIRAPFNAHETVYSPCKRGQICEIYITEKCWARLGPQNTQFMEPFQFIKMLNERMQKEPACAGDQAKSLSWPDDCYPKGSAMICGCPDGLVTTVEGHDCPCDATIKKRKMLRKALNRIDKSHRGLSRDELFAAWVKGEVEIHPTEKGGMEFFVPEHQTFTFTQGHPALEGKDRWSASVGG